MTDWRRRLEASVTRAWYQGAAWLWLMWPLSLLFGVVSALRRRRLKRLAPSLPVPVIVVGGITVGGTGKTPVIIALVKALGERGLSVGVVSRGYGAMTGDDIEWVDEQSSPSRVGDEPVVIARSCHCPVVVGRNRLLAVRNLIECCDLDVVLSDDGLQHYALPRDFEIVVLDAQRRLGNRRLLPMGPLREGPWRLDTVDWILERNGHQAERAFQYVPESLYQLSTGTTLAVHDALAGWAAGKQITAVTGLGQPEQFFTTLEQVGFAIRCVSFPDHYSLTDADISAIQADIIIMTEKDAVKIVASTDPRIWVLTISTDLPDGLVDTLVERFTPSRTY